MNNGVLKSSFRDPSGFLFRKNGVLYRQVNQIYKDNFDLLIESGLYEKLLGSQLMIPHAESDIEHAESDRVYKVIQPELIPYISYPYEWCFSQLKDAALLTLRIQKTALEFGMSLKDASAYNVQFRNGKPVFLDTLSFEKYDEGSPWVAYRQFCQHFLAPLALASYVDIRLLQLLRSYIDGVPLDLASGLLPFRSRFRFPLLTHIHLHAKSQKHYADKTVTTSKRKMSRISFLGLIDNLEGAIGGLKWRARGTEWADYYEGNTNYSADALSEKKKMVSEYLDKLAPESVFDLGANMGLFSRVASEKGIKTISFDIDPAAVEINYIETVRRGEIDILPLVLDLTNPSSGIGWELRERMSWMERAPADTALALALIHHLAISNNLPMGRIANFFSEICRSLIIEFVPKTDSQVQKLLATRDDIFPEYTQKDFEREFSGCFNIRESQNISGSERFLYCMERKEKLV